MAIPEPSWLVLSGWHVMSRYVGDEPTFFIVSVFVRLAR
jgi:hypothetical protein